mgnify:CR=1 FL=1|jgi:hypothetical protein
MKTFKITAEIWVRAENKRQANELLYSECKWFLSLDNDLLSIQISEASKTNDKEVL